MYNNKTILSVTEWQNLLATLKTMIERYDIGNVKEAVEYLYGRVGQ